MRASIVLALCIFTAFHVKLGIGSRHKRKLFVPNGKSKDCYDLICNDSLNYPEAHIMKNLNKNKKLYEKVFGSIIEPSENFMIPVAKSGFDEKEEKSFCDTRRITLFPRVAYDVQLKPRFVVNIAGHQQSVTFEICVSDKCFESDFLLGYKTGCKQLYNNVRLLFLTETGDLEYGQFSVPSTCVCKYIVAN